MRKVVFFALGSLVAAGLLWSLRAAVWAPSGGGAPAGAASPGNVAKEKAAAGTKGGGAGAIAVEVGTARAARTRSDIRAIGTLQSDESVRLAPEISGRLSEITFAEGQPVAQGEPLLKLDDALARGELAQAKARLELAEANNTRARTLSRSGNVTERTSDEARATFEQAAAEVELAETRLAKHVLRAPFNGMAGIRLVSIGAYVSAGTALVNIEKIDALKVDFKVPELFLRGVAVDQEIEVEVDAIPGRKFKGTVYAINPLVDVNGRAVEIRARLPNAEAALRPGLFARVLVKGLTERETVLIPEGALLPRGGETFIFRVEQGRAAEAKVRIGERRDGEVEVLEGLPAGATIVVAGQQKLRNGVPVEIVPAAGAKPAAGPKGAVPIGQGGRS